MTNYQYISTLSAAQIEQLHALYQQEWWSKGRTLAETRELLRHTDYLFGLCEASSGRLLAFARVLSDRVCRAMIFDVIVAADYRGQGLGKALLGQIISHPELMQVELIGLGCLPDVMPFYEQFGFVQSPQHLLGRQQR